MTDLFTAAYAEVQAAAPYIQQALASPFAQQVSLQRFGGAAAPFRALIGQVEDQSTDAPGVVEPGISSRSVTVVLPPDAPVADVGFIVTLADGQVLVPVAVALNPAGLDLLWVVRMAALVERTRVSLLTFTLAGQGMTQDRHGNPIPVPGVPLPVSARLVATADPKLRDEVGADSAEVVLVGRWGTLTAPQARPPGVSWGSTSPLTLDGQPGVLSIALAYPDSDLAQEAQFGARFLARWRAT
ncbi:hypothetical protein [Deinococcus sp. Leaf326]|uniref:hypothetical protein n=1 Tax=Deinococcus sp. Leaf326 TaxID=1736338 RepID=UPI0006FB56F5|nr:hypothetical protein [Deinococcus sp. Leaf326]KQR33125.1 hypothetical protein ASF71_16675 [Deinococcus sp. Leaf326]